MAPGNPCDDTPNVSRLATPTNEVKIYDFKGVEKFSKKYYKNNFTIRGLKHFAKGHYILHLTDSKGHTKREVIVIE